MDVSFVATPAASAQVDLLVVGVDDTFETSLPEVLGDFGTSLAGWLTARTFEPEAGACRLVPSLGRIGAGQVAIVGLGDRGPAAWAKAAGKIGSVARAEKATTVAAHLGALDTGAAQAVVEFVQVGNYAWDTYMPEAKRTPALATLQLLGAEPEGGAEALRQATIRGAWQRKARDLVNMPAADLYPTTLAEHAEALASLPHVTVDVWDLARCRKEGLVGIEAVGRGSAKPGVMVRISYTPPDAVDHVALVGKGVTFDSGGLSLKPSNAMQTMRCDMGGAATALAATGAIAELGLPVAVDTFLPCVENMNDGDCYKLGDVLTYRNGVTVEIHNTDAEGRLVLADGLCLASEIEGVSRIVNMATLTGAIIVAIGPDYTGVFTKDDGLAGELTAAAGQAAEKMWRMPMDDAYKRMLKGTWSQIKNVGGREAGSVTAALFLDHFVSGDATFAHLDIAGTAFVDTAVEPYVKGGTGQVVRTLVSWAQSLGS